MKSKRSQQVSTKDYDMVVGLLQKKEKSQRDLETIFNKISLLNGFNMFIQNYFQGSDVSEQIKICGDLVYERKNKGDIIFSQEEASNNKLYIILKGSCMVFLMKDLDFQDDIEEEEEVQRLRQAQAQQQDNKRSSLSHIADIQQKDIQKISLTILEKLKTIGHKYQKQISIDFEKQNFTSDEITAFKKRYGKTTRLLEAGSIFGERALLTNQPRTATIVAGSHPTELVILDRDKFLPALEELKRTLQLRRDILFQIFKDMDNYSSARGHYITEQDQKEDKLYIIADGEAQIMKRIDVQVTENYSQEKVAKLSIIGPGVMVGDEIMLRNDQKYLYTTEVISIKASVLVADKKIIDRKFPKDLRDYLKKISVNKERGRKVLLEMKEEDLKVEILSQLKKDQNRKLMQESGYNNKSEEEKNKIVQMYKNQKQAVYDILGQQSMRQSNDDNHIQQDILRGVVSQQKQELPQIQSPSQLVLPFINERQNDASINNAYGVKYAPQNTNIFDVKSLVFDFGDGKNIQNAKRIEKILNAKNRKQRMHQNLPLNSIQQNMQKNINQVKSKQDLKILELANQFDQSNIQSILQNRNRDANNRNNNNNNDGFVRMVSNQNSKTNIKEEGQTTGKHSRVASDYYHEGSLSMIIQNSNSNKQQVLPCVNYTPKIIHSTKAKFNQSGEDSKPLRRTMLINTFSKSNSSNIKMTDSLVQGTLHLSPTRILKSQKDNLVKLDLTKLRAFQDSQNQNINQLIQLQDHITSKPALNYEDSNNSAETLFSTKDQLDIDRQQSQSQLTPSNNTNLSNNHKTQHTTNSLQNFQNNDQFNDKLNQKINDDDYNDNNNNNNANIGEIVQNSQKQKQLLKDKQEEINLNTPKQSQIKSIEHLSQSKAQSTQNDNQQVMKVLSRNTGVFFPLTVSKPNKINNIISSTLRTQSTRKLTKLKDENYGGVLSIFQKQNNQNQPNRFLIQDDSYNVQNNNQLGQYFNIVNYNKNK